jgi:hypothetical protein
MLAVTYYDCTTKQEEVVKYVNRAARKRAIRYKLLGLSGREGGPGPELVVFFWSFTVVPLFIDCKN